MRLLVVFFMLMIFCKSISAQKGIFIDENNDTISKNKFIKKWRNKDLMLSTWHYLGEDGKRYHKLKRNLYLKGVFNYNEIKTQLEYIIERNIINNNVILLEFVFKDDLCSSLRDNKWTKNEIMRRKSFFKPMRKKFLDNNIVFISLYERGITLNNSIKNKNEYFFIDKNAFFRNKLFTTPTLCGSFALIKPNGETLIRNGEYRPDWMANHLKPENWKQFFNEQ